MAKRTRYSGRPSPKPATRRLGPRTVSSSPSAGPSTASVSPGLRSGGLTEAELDRAAAIEAELVAREKAAIAENARRRARAQHMDVATVGDPSQPLSIRAAHEYAYVARDVKRIAATAALMLGILAAIWILVNLGGGLG